MSTPSQSPRKATMDLTLDVRCWWTRFKAKHLLETTLGRTLTADQVVSYILSEPKRGAALLQRVHKLWDELPDPTGHDLPSGNRYTKAARLKDS